MPELNSTQSQAGQGLSKKAKVFNPYSGGRCLNAIWESKLDLHKSAILQWLANKLDFRTDFSGPIRISQTTLSIKTKMSKRTLIRKILELESEGYLTCRDSSGVNEYRIARKIFDEYAKSRAKLASDTESPADMTSDTESPGSDRESLGSDTESYPYSPSYPLLISPIYLRHTSGYILGHSAAEQIRRYDNINFTLLKERKSMPLNTHPFMTTLKEGKAAKEAKKTTLQELPTTKPMLGETSNELFNKYKNHFSGGFGRFCFKAQRAMWDQSTLNDCVDELKKIVEFYHGSGKHAACQSAAHRRMDDKEYTEHLLNEAIGTKKRVKADKLSKQRQIAARLERERLEANPEWRAEQEVKRKARVKKLLEIKERMKRL